MRRLAITIFAVFYAVLILSGTAARSNDWASRQKHGISGGKVEKSEPRFLGKKNIERGFVVETPKEVIMPTLSERFTVFFSIDCYVTPAGLPVSWRAPPVRI